jgi:hypothetical protein
MTRKGKQSGTEVLRAIADEVGLTEPRTVKRPAKKRRVSKRVPRQPAKARRIR